MVSYELYVKEETLAPVKLNETLSDEENIIFPACRGEYFIYADYSGVPHVSEMWVDLAHLEDYISLYRRDPSMKVHPLTYTIQKLPNGNVVPAGTTLALVKYTVFATEGLFSSVMGLVLKKYYEAHI